MTVMRCSLGHLVLKVQDRYRTGNDVTSVLTLDPGWTLASLDTTVFLPLNSSPVPRDAAGYKFI